LLQGDTVRVRTTAPLPPDLVTRLRAAKPAIVAVLSAGKRDNSDDIPAEWTRGAELLDPETPLGDFPAAAWERVVGDIYGFINSSAARQAAQLGWSTLMLFGCCRFKPYARIDRAGLLLLLRGDRIVSIEPNRATIAAKLGGSTSTCRCRPIDPAHVMPIWELAEANGPADDAA
jgi:hypothetical protein